MPRRSIRSDSPRRGHPGGEADDGEGKGKGNPNGHLR